jgi:hypothetical protein
MEAGCIHTYENSIMKPTKLSLKTWGRGGGKLEYNERVDLVQGILYAFMVLSYWNFLALFVYNNSKLNWKIINREKK